jgi:phosphoglycerol transferase MdoB-like AlkP superfamily enzyme
MKNKPLIGAILTMVGIYLLISFAIWDLNAKHWHTEVRAMYSFFAPMFSGLAYSAIKQFTIE